MEGGLFLVFVIIALIARAIEAMTKGRSGPPPGQPRPRPRPVPRAEHDESWRTRTLPQGRTPAPSDEVPPDATEDAAAAMIPDDLWEILTGRPKPRPQHVPAPQPSSHYEPYVDVEADVDEELAAYDRVPDEVAEYERRRRAEEERRKRERRELTERRLRERDIYSAAKAPKVYSLEQPLPPAVRRHAEFHAKIDDTPEVKPLQRRRRARGWLIRGGDLKRAVVLQEVLGPPKGLE